MSEENASIQRRDFLKVAGVAAGAALASPALIAHADAPPTPAAAPEAPVLAAGTPATEAITLADTPPVLGYQFQLLFNGALFATFSEVTGIGSESPVIVYNQGSGGSSSLPGQTKWTPIKLKRGMTQDLSLWDWRALVSSGKAAKFRKSGSIVMGKILPSGEASRVAQWNFTNGWPASIEAPVAAADNQGVALEQIVIVHDGIVRVPAIT